MIPWNGYKRISQRMLPNYPVGCGVTSCVYNKSGVCDNTTINNANGDAVCHKWNKRKLLESLKKL